MFMTEFKQQDFVLQPSLLYFFNFRPYFPILRAVRDSEKK